MLGSVAGYADGAGEHKENLVIFSTRGGIIVPEKEVTLILPEDDNLITEFRRRGNVYVMDAWVRKNDVVAGALRSGGDVGAVDVPFHRQAQP